MSSIFLEVKNIRTQIGDGDRALRVVDDVSFQIQRGETLALLGESGCGKSMTALSILRLLPKPAGKVVSGQVLVDGVDVLTLPESQMRDVRGSKIAMIFQEPMTSLNPVMTVGEQIIESLQQHTDLSSKAARLKVLELLDAVGIPDIERRYSEYPHQLSGGMKQRVMIAIALATEPDLLIADEPTTALDVTIQAQVLDLLRDLQQKRGMAVMLITHDLGVVAQMADRVAVMYAGEIVEQINRQDFFTSPRHPYSQKLFAALPNHQKRNQPLTVIHGSVPMLNQKFGGCRFAPRCDSAWKDCLSQLPRWIETEKNEGLRCHLADKQMTQGELINQWHEVPIEKDAGMDPLAVGTPLLDVSELRVHFPIRRGLFKRVVGHVKAVDGVDVCIPVGETLALVGESGCGKTTVGKSILQLIRPTSGSVLFRSTDLCTLSHTQLKQRRSDFQIIFQDPYSSMNPRMKVGDILEEGMVAQKIGKNRAERQRRIAELLQEVGMQPEHVHRYPHEFSGGQRQRICIARALAVHPQLIVCDEPTSALDVSVQAQILNLLKDLQRNLGLSYLFITHDMSVVAYLADRVAVMYLGRIVEVGSIQEILNQPRHPYTQALLSAVPVLDQEEERTIIKLEGDMPSPSNPPCGCYFHPRCPQVMEKCRQTYPDAVGLSRTHMASCHLLA
ncbi:MAG: ABC transporter ATP-binding protein [Gammaproteobacteria bacterium]